MILDDRDGRSVVDGLEAYLLALEGRPEEALSRLGENDDPESLLRRLTILLDAERFDEAASVVRGRPPHERWCAQAVAALAAVGDEAESRRFVEWAHGQRDPVLWPATLVALARHRFLRAFPVRPTRKPLLPGELTPDEREVVLKAAKDLAPIVTMVKAQRRVLTGVEASAVAVAMEFAHFLADRDEEAELADLLWARTPLPIHYAYAVIRKAVPPNPDLPDRLRRERGESFEANRLAAFVEGTFLGRPGDAVKAVDQLLADFPSPDHQQQAAHLLLLLSAELPSEEQAAIRRRAEGLLAPDTEYSRFREIESHIQAKRFPEASALLEASPNHEHPAWLEMMAAVREGEGRYGDAVDLLERATEILPEEGLLRNAAAVAARHGRHADAVRFLERLLKAAPDDVGAGEHLGDLLVRTGHYERAAERFGRLRRLDPTNPAYGLNEAVCLTRCLRLDESLQVYDALCEAERPPVEAVIGRAALLKAMNRSNEGFSSLERHRAAYWDHPRFLKAYVDLGYAANRENEAHEGFLRLHQLQADGLIEPELDSIGIDELVDLIRKRRESYETLGLEVLRGRLPWLLADRSASLPAVAAFASRTRAVRWLSCEPAARARQTVYATNGFVINSDGQGRRRAEPMQAPGPGQAVAIDLSSLITLHRLGLLGTAAEYFGECLYPSAYLAASFRDLDRLTVHQPSRSDAARTIVADVDAGRILVAETEDLPFVDEHRPDQSASAGVCYAFADLAAPLKASHLLSDASSAQLAGLARRPGVSGATGRPLETNEAIRVDRSSLETLYQLGLMRAVTSGFRVHIGKPDLEGLRADIAGGQEQLNLRRQHESLWEAITSDRRFSAVRHEVPPELGKADDSGESHGEDDSWLSLCSVFAASERGLPLLADDRACQMFVHHTRSDASAAFSTDLLVAALLRHERITADQAADAFLRLIEWRFKFLVVPAEVVVAVAKRHLLTPPGAPLRRIARYVQDCMRDPGLFAGPESTDPPVTMANKLFLAWTTVVSEFVASVWQDPSVSEEAARGVSEWALTECLPSPPHAAGVRGRVLAELQAKLVLSQAFLQSASCPDLSRASGMIATVAGVAGVRARDYFAELAEVVDGL